jgi:hypothetical protein
MTHTPIEKIQAERNKQMGGSSDAGAYIIHRAFESAMAIIHQHQAQCIQTPPASIHQNEQSIQTEVVERVAMAIYLHMFPERDKTDWVMEGTLRDAYTDCAKSAITAMGTSGCRATPEFSRDSASRGSLPDRTKKASPEASTNEGMRR